MRRVLFLSVATCVAVACGGAAQQDLSGDDNGSSSGGSSSSGSSSGGADGGSSGSVGDAKVDGAGKDTGPDVGPPPPGTIATQIYISDLFENCMPVIAADPITVKGTVTIQNGTNSAIGPVSFLEGTFLDPKTNAPIATFKLKPVTMQAVPPGGSQTVNIEKQSNSASPSNGCSTLTCSSQVIVQVDASGTGVPTNAHIQTNPITVGCAI
jgi:hypothetical protein